MPPTSTYSLTDRLLGGDLAGMLTEWRKTGASFDAIALRLRDDHDISIGRSTVQRWCAELGIEPAGAPVGDPSPTGSAN